LKLIHERMVKIAQDAGVTAGRRMRVDTTVVETDIHHPTDSTLMGDGVRVLTRTMRKSWPRRCPAGDTAVPPHTAAPAEHAHWPNSEARTFAGHFSTCCRASRRCPYHFTAIFNLRR